MSDPPPKPAPGAPVPAAAADAAPVLIVDDDRGSLLGARQILEDLRQPIFCASSGEAALRQVLAREFAVILLDVLMPGMDGYEIATLIRSRQRSSHVPIIFLSAMGHDRSHLFRGYEAGAVDFVFKPVEPLILRSKVSVFIDMFRKSQEIQRHAEEEKRLLAENLRVQIQQMETAQALERSRAQQSVTLESLPLAIYAADAGGGFRLRSFAGGSPERICGFPPEAFAADPGLWLSRVHSDDRRGVLASLARLSEVGAFECEYRWLCADGKYRWFFDRGVLAPDSAGELFGVWLDVMERRELEQQLVHAQKVEAMGRMTGGIAHDFNNMLTVVLGSLERAMPLIGDNPTVRRRLDMAMQGAVRCSDLTKRLLSFARRQALEPRVLRLSEQMDSLRGLLERTLGERVVIETACAEDLWPVFVDPPQLESAIVNLAINARDAMPNGGRLRIEIGNQHLDAEAAAALDLAAGDYARILVSDTGLGMPPEVMARAAEPFFTTKEHGHGTGLGLSMLHGFIRQSQGTVTIDSEVGCGTRVTLYLPRSPGGVAQDVELQPAAPEVDLSDHTVLVVEDDDAVREVAVAMFEDFGCRVITAGTAAEGLEALDRHPDVALLFTDVALPGGRDGCEMAQAAVERRPGLPVLLCSAHRPNAPVELVHGSRCHFLPKPYQAAELANALVVLLQENRPVAAARA